MAVVLSLAQLRLGPVLVRREGEFREITPRATVCVALARGHGETDAVEALRTAQGDLAWLILASESGGEGVKVIKPGSASLAASLTSGTCGLPVWSTEEVALAEGIGHGPGEVRGDGIVIGEDRSIVAEELVALVVPEDGLQIDRTASPVAIPVSPLYCSHTAQGTYKILSTVSQLLVVLGFSQIKESPPSAGSAPLRISSTHGLTMPFCVWKTRILSPVLVYRALVSPNTSTALPTELTLM